jgi:predicted AAA+ superfamily ATPase
VLLEIAEVMKRTESLAGRIAYRELAPLNIAETVADTPEAPWLRGGFPQSFLARVDARSLDWRRDFLRTAVSNQWPESPGRSHIRRGGPEVQSGLR